MPQTSSTREYPIPGNLKKDWEDAIGTMSKERWVTLRLFGYKEKPKLPPGSQGKINKFWNDVKKLYPKIKGKDLKVSNDHKFIVVKDKK